MAGSARAFAEDRRFHVDGVPAGLEAHPERLAQRDLRRTQIEVPGAVAADVDLCPVRVDERDVDLAQRIEAALGAVDRAGDGERRVRAAAVDVAGEAGLARPMLRARTDVALLGTERIRECVTHRIAAA